MQKIGIIGAGAWGTALAKSLQSVGRDITIWAREPDVVNDINTNHKNSLYLPDIDLDPSINATDSLTEASGESDALLIVTPAQFVRPTLQALKADIADGKPFIICAKGIEIDTGNLMSQVAEEVVPGSTFGIMTGPTFAREIAQGLPSAVTVAINEKDVAQEIVDSLSSRTLRTYITDDVLGAQIGGAVKNVIAIACGVIIGRGMGDSARAALVTRGVAEMGRLASALGAKKETLMGMCGFGDLLLTCTSMQSRNYSLGIELGKGKTLEEILGPRKSVTEGVHTAKALMTMAKNNAVDMPISGSVHQCLSEGVSIDEAIAKMLERPLKPEGQ